MNRIYNAASVSVQRIPSQLVVEGQTVNVLVESTVVQLTPTDNPSENSTIKMVIPGTETVFEQGSQYEVSFTKREA